MDTEIVEILDLGRRYKLGGLYDAVTGKFAVPEEPVGGDRVIIERFDPPSDDYQIFPSTDIRRKYATLDSDSVLSCTMKLSVLTGITPAKSTAAFYTDQSNESSNQVTLRRTIETVKHTLKDPEAFAKGTTTKNVNATHLIVSVTFGLTSFTVFTMPRSPDEDAEDQHKGLETAVKSAARQGKATRKNDALDEVDCSYYGDMKLLRKVSSFEDAFNVFSTQLAYTEKSEKNTVPVRIGLLPLHYLSEITDPKSFTPTTSKMFNEIFRVFEKLNGAKVLAVELASTTFCQKLPMYKEDFAAFVQSVVDYEDELKKRLRDVLPKTWAGLEDEKVIRRMLQAHQASHFGEEQLTKWLEAKRDEQDTLASILIQLRQFPFCSKKAELNAKLNNVALKDVICLNIYEKVLKDNWTSVLRQFAMDNEAQTEEFDASATWHQNIRNKAAVRKEITTFLTLAEEHGNDPQKAFVVNVSNDKSDSLLKIVQYADGTASKLLLNGKSHSQKYCSRSPVMPSENHLYQNGSPLRSGPYPSVNPEMRYAELLLHDSTPIPHTVPVIYDVQMKRTYFDQIARISRYEIGNRPTDTVEEKIVMLTGASGPGKPRLINGLINYMFNVKWDDPFRFRAILDEVEGIGANVTQEITAYTIHNQFDCPASYSLTIIDMPGFYAGDVMNLKEHMHTYDQLSSFFNGKGRHGVDHVDAVGIVVESSLSRLTASQKLAVDSTLSTFGSDIAGNIFVLSSSSNHQEPPVLAALNAADVPFNSIYRFNSTALYSDNTDAESVAKWYWKIGQKSIGQFLTGLNQAKPKSLSLTKEVIKEQKRLADRLLKLQPHIQAGLEKIKEICARRQAIRQCRTENMGKHDAVSGTAFQISPKGEFYQKPCHSMCSHPGEKSAVSDGLACADPNAHGSCDCDPEKCSWARHISKQVRNVRNKTTKMPNKPKKQKKKQKESTEKVAATMLAEELQEQLRDLRTLNGHLELMTNDVVQLLDATKECATRLDRIALRGNPLTSVTYIDSLIQMEKQEADNGYEARIAQLKKARKEVELLENYSKVQQFAGQAEKLQKSVRRQCEVGLAKYSLSVR